MRPSDTPDGTLMSVSRPCQLPLLRYGSMSSLPLESLDQSLGFALNLKDLDRLVARAGS